MKRHILDPFQTVDKVHGIRRGFFCYKELESQYL